MKFENEEQVAEYVARSIRQQAEAEIDRLVAEGIPRAWIDEHLELAPLEVQAKADGGFEFVTRFRFKRPTVVVPCAPVKLTARGLGFDDGGES